MRGMRTLSTPLGLGICTLLLAGCQSLPSRSVMDSAAWHIHLQRSELPAVLLLGEQHDAPEHQQWQQATVQTLIDRQKLAAVVLEMADKQHGTAGLPRTATDDEVQQALRWNDQGWPWKAYGPTIMTAVRAGVPVYGGNLPRSQMRSVMQQDRWDQHLPAPAWEQQREAIRSGHCNLLPEAQIIPMARIQLAKDANLALMGSAAREPGKTVVLMAGRGHVLRSVGIPTWLPKDANHIVAIAQAGTTPPIAAQEADFIIRTPALPEKDHCAVLEAQWRKATK